MNNGGCANGCWMPAFAGMTVRGFGATHDPHRHRRRRGDQRAHPRARASADRSVGPERPGQQGRRRRGRRRRRGSGCGQGLRPRRRHRSQRAALGPRSQGAAPDQRARRREGRVRRRLLLGPVSGYRARQLGRGNPRRHDRGDRSRHRRHRRALRRHQGRHRARSRTSPPSGCSRRRRWRRARPARRSSPTRRTPGRRRGTSGCWKAPAWT